MPNASWQASNNRRARREMVGNWVVGSRYAHVEEVNALDNRA
jgi:hypothetical protein